MNEIINEHLAFFKPEAAAKNIKLKISGQSEYKRVIRTDKNKLDSILTNLIKNAIKFTSDGTIEFGCNLKNDQLKFFVKDDGIGIAPERVEAIFNRFEQAEMGINRGHEGTGLGLSISKAYAEMLGGKLWVESEKGKGSTFFFTINYLPPAEKELDAETDIPDVKEPEQFVKVLVVEDDEISFSLVKTYLSKEKIELFHAFHGKEAIDILKKNPNINLVLMDLKMPVMDGYAATQEIRKFNPTIPIVAQTAYALEGDREKALKAGCTDYISKPLRKAELIQKISELMEL